MKRPNCNYENEEGAEYCNLCDFVFKREDSLASSQNTEQVTQKLQNDEVVDDSPSHPKSYLSRLKDSWLILKCCWHVLSEDKELLLFPILSAIGQISVFVIFIWLFGSPFLYPDGVEILRTDPFHYGLQPYIHWFIVVFAIYFVSTFFQAAIAASVSRRLSGENPTIASDISTALKHLKKITGLVFLISIFIFIMSFFRNKGWLQRMVGEVVEMAVEIACFFVVPIIIIEDAGPIDAIKRSVQLLRDSWGEQIGGKVSLSAIVSLIQIPAIILFVLAFKVDMSAADPMKIPYSINFFNLGLAGIYLIITFAVYDTLSEIFRTALYIYARDKKVPVGFEAASLDKAFMAAEV